MLGILLMGKALGGIRRHLEVAMEGLVLGLFCVLAVACLDADGTKDGASYLVADTLPPQWSWAESVADGVKYTALARIHHGFAGSLLDVNLTARDTGTGGPVPVAPLSASAPEVRLSRTPDHARRASWRSQRLEASACQYLNGGRSTAVPVFPGGPAGTASMEVKVDSSRVECRYHIPIMLGDSLPPGPYYVTTLIPTGQQSIELQGRTLFLSGDTLPPVGSEEAIRAQLHYEAQVRAVESVNVPGMGAGPWLEIEVRLTNIGDRRVGLSYGANPLGLRVYRSAERSGEPVWNREPGGGIAIQRLAVISPGETIGAPDFHLRVPVREIMGDSLADGKYYFSVVVELDGRQMLQTPEGVLEEFSRTTAVLPAGEANLSASGRRSPE